MQAAKIFLSSLLFFVVFSVLGTAVGFGVGYTMTTLENEGLFTSWRQLDHSQKFDQIVDVSFQTIWAKAVDGKLYSREFYCYRDPSCDQWMESKEVPEDTNYAYEQLIKKSDSCQLPTLQFFKEPPGNPIECAQVKFYGMENETNACFTLLDDGTIWAWKFTSSLVEDAIVPVFFSFAGFVPGIIAFIAFTIRRAEKNQTRAIIVNDQ